MVKPAPEREPVDGAGAPVVCFRNRPLPPGMTLDMAVEAERFITEWEVSSDQPDQLSAALFRLFAGLETPPLVRG